MNILITGATGFVGRNLICRLKSQHNLYVLVRHGSNWSELGVEHVFEFSDNIFQLGEYLKRNRIDGIIHLASLYITEHKAEQICDIVHSNVYLGTALLEACKLSGTKWFLNTGTIWQNFNSQNYSDEYHPVNLYAASKQAFMTMAQYYIETSNIRFCTLKLCDTYGANDTRRKIFSLFNEIADTGRSLEMSPGEQKLDIIHIDDVVEGFAMLAEMLNEEKNLRKEYVLSSGEQKSLKDWASLYEKHYKVKLNIIWGGRPYRQREVMNPYVGYVLEGWKPLVTKSNLLDGSE